MSTFFSALLSTSETEGSTNSNSSTNKNQTRKDVTFTEISLQVRVYKRDRARKVLNSLIPTLSSGKIEIRNNRLGFQFLREPLMDIIYRHQTALITCFSPPDQRFAKHHPLTEIHLDNCRVEAFPTDFFNIPTLRVLQMPNNEITVIPAGITRLTALEELGIQNNKIKFLPREMQFLTSLKRLDISNNDIQSLPLPLLPLTQLESVSLSGNGFLTKAASEQDPSDKELPSTLVYDSESTINLYTPDEASLIPQEVIAQGDMQILEFLRQRSDQLLLKEYVNTTKIIFLYDGSAGQQYVSTLLNRKNQTVVLNSDAKPETLSIQRNLHSLSICDWSFDINRSNQEATTNSHPSTSTATTSQLLSFVAYDFAIGYGENNWSPAYRAMLPLFANDSAIYVIAYDVRQIDVLAASNASDACSPSLREWLHLIQKLSPSATVILLAVDNEGSGAMSHSQPAPQKQFTRSALNQRHAALAKQFPQIKYCISVPNGYCFRPHEKTPASTNITNASGNWIECFQQTIAEMVLVEEKYKLPIERRMVPFIKTTRSEILMNMLKHELQQYAVATNKTLALLLNRGGLYDIVACDWDEFKQHSGFTFSQLDHENELHLVASMLHQWGHLAHYQYLDDTILRDFIISQPQWLFQLCANMTIVLSRHSKFSRGIVTRGGFETEILRAAIPQQKNERVQTITSYQLTAFLHLLWQLDIMILGHDYETMIFPPLIPRVSKVITSPYSFYAPSALYDHHNCMSFDIMIAAPGLRQGIDLEALLIRVVSRLTECFILSELCSTGAVLGSKEGISTYLQLSLTGNSIVVYSYGGYNDSNYWELFFFIHQCIVDYSRPRPGIN